MDPTRIKLRHKLVDIKNTDKSRWTETWKKKGTQDISNFPHPSRVALIGPPSVGKSFIMKHLKTLLIIDDVEFSSLSKEQMARLNKIFRYGSSHKNITVYVSHQSFFDLPLLVRKLCNVYVLWKPRSVMELKTIANRVGYTSTQLEYIFENVCDEYRDSLCIDLHINAPAILRKNLWEPFELPRGLK
jgi:hypothetical protein